MSDSGIATELVASKLLPPGSGRALPSAPRLNQAPPPAHRTTFQTKITPARRAFNAAGVGSEVIAHLQQSKLFRDYQHAFEVSLGLPLVLRAAGSFRTPLQGSGRVNSFCALMTQSSRTCASCLQLQQRIEEQAILEAQTQQCYAGLNETVVPVRAGGTVLGYLQTGQVFFTAPGKKQFKAVGLLVRTGEAGLDLREMEAAYSHTRVIPRKQYESVIRLLVIFAEHLASVSNQLLLAEATAESPAITKARSFIAAHQNQELCLGEVARAVHMSVFHFCKYFKRSTGLTFTEYLARARIEAVKQLLTNAHLRIGEAAFAAGFQSLSQFNRVFKRVTGEAPGHYRDRLHKLNRKTSRNAAYGCAA